MPWLALAVPLVAVTVLGLLLNGYILLVVLLTKQVHTANTLLLLHLGAVDVLLCVIFLLFAAPGTLGARGPTDAASSWASAPPLCSLHSFLAALLHPLAVWTVCGLNCDRCAAIAAPLHYARLVSTRRAAVFLLSSWILCLALALPPLFLPSPLAPREQQLDSQEDSGWNSTSSTPPCPPTNSVSTSAPYLLLLVPGGCNPDSLQDPAPSHVSTPPYSPWYPSAYAVLTLLLPAALILACNIKVLTIARYHRHRIAAAIFEVTLSAQVTITHQRNPFPLTKPRPPTAGPGGWIGSGLFGNRRSALLTVVQLVGSLLLLYFPFYSVMLWRSFKGIEGGESGGGVPPLLLTASSALLACSPPVNGFIYGVRSKVLRRTFANYWRKQMSKSAVNQEIQARTPSTCGSRRPSLTPLGLQRRASMDACLGLPALPPPPSSATSTSSSSSANSTAGGGRALPPPRPRITRVASELSWRPLGVASPVAGMTQNVPRRSRSFRERRITTPGFHTLQVPNLQRCESAVGCHKEPHPNANTPFLGRSQYFLQRVLGYYQQGRAPHPVATRRSPRIMVTRALSQEESSSTGDGKGAIGVGEEGSGAGSSSMGSGGGERRLSASTTTLLERRMSIGRGGGEDGSGMDREADEGLTMAISKLGLARRCEGGRGGVGVVAGKKEKVPAPQEGGEGAVGGGEGGGGGDGSRPRLCSSLDSIPVRGEEGGAEAAVVVGGGVGGGGKSAMGVVKGALRTKGASAASRRIRFGLGDPEHHSWPGRTRGGGGEVGEEEEDVEEVEEGVRGSTAEA